MAGLVVGIVQAGASEIDAVRPNMARLNYADTFRSTSCSATLIAPGAALTSQGCISRVPATALHLLVGYDRGEWAVHRRVRATIEDPTRNGLALLCLDETVEGAVQMATATLEIGDSVTIASYRAPRPHVLSADICTAVEAADAIAVLEKCDTGAGMEGGGAFRVTGTGPELAGVVTVQADDVVVLRGWTGEPPAELCRDA